MCVKREELDKTQVVQVLMVLVKPICAEDVSAALSSRFHSPREEKQLIERNECFEPEMTPLL